MQRVQSVTSRMGHVYTLLRPSPIRAPVGATVMHSNARNSKCVDLESPEEGRSGPNILEMWMSMVSLLFLYLVD